MDVCVFSIPKSGDCGVGLCVVFLWAVVEEQEQINEED